jgi:hypothetical protein
MSLSEYSHTLKENLPIPSKVGIKKWNYDATKKFQDKWIAKFPWAWVGYTQGGKFAHCQMYNLYWGRKKRQIICS